MLKKLLKSLLLIAVVYFAATGNNFAQTNDNLPKRVNFSYSQNPKTKAKPSGDGNKQSNSEVASKVNSQLNTDNIPAQSIVDGSSVNSDETKNPSIAKKTLEIAKRASAEAVSPTEIYKVGVGDILFISLQNAPSNSSSYFTVLNDGTIDYPLTGQMVSVSGLTIEEIEDLLKSKIKLFENPQVAVKVREHASHSITVLGLVEKAGIKFLPREAMPLYFVRAEAVVQSKANQAVIKHANSGTEILDLNDAKNDNVLIFPGDIVEFKYREDNENASRQPQFYYIGGNVVSGGQKDFHRGLTLTQAILASGGLRKSNVKKIIIRRKNVQSLLVATEVNIKLINDGKEPDPTLEVGDTIEVGN
jgi:protein involved in polysaccharide export with SLBB domain